MKALIIDDEPLPAKRLASMIEKYCVEVQNVELCSRPSKALELVKDTTYDVIFLDVEMPEMTGFDFLDHAILPNETKIIMTTAYEQYAVKAFEADAIHYLVKPVKESDLTKAVRKVCETVKVSETINNQDGVVSIYLGDEYYIIKEIDIIRLEADTSYTKVVTIDRTLLASKSIGYYEAKLSKGKFFRCHNSHIINVSAIIKFSKGRNGYIHLRNEEVVPVSGSKKKELEDRMGI